MCSYTNKMKYRPYTCPRKTTFVEREIPELPIVYARRLRNLHKLTLMLTLVHLTSCCADKQCYDLQPKIYYLVGLYIQCLFFV